MMSQNFEFREEEEVFFDSRDDALSSSSSCPDSPVRNGEFEGVGSSAFVDNWMKEPESVRSRRDKFMRMMGIDFGRSSSLVRVELDGELKLENEIEAEDGEIVVDSRAEIGNKGTEKKYSISSWSSEATSTSYGGLSEENYVCSIRNLDDGTVFVVDEVSNDGTLKSLRKVGSDRTISVNDFEKNFGTSSLVLQLMRRDSSATSNSNKSVKRKKLGWLKKLGAVAWIVNRQGEMSVSSSSDSSKGGSTHAQRVRVRTYRKHSKELSAIYKGQDIKAHDGPILTMKFSPDGQYLATGGEDGVVCVWRVLECDRTEGGIDIAEDDPSCIYFTVDHNSELVPLHDDQEKKSKYAATRRSPNLSCVVIPHHVFKLSEEPLHQFRGHDGYILDLSWSNNQCLLSSSTDKSVRLWQVGTEGCLKVFAHKNYVTGVQFNPINENYFISVSIDGKVRVWEIPASHVVDYVDVKEIITAVCYRPDGKGAVVGTLKGNCRFYDASDNHLELEKQISFHGNKKSLMRRITGFQFCPTDSQKLMVTSADSRIRILDRGDVKCKYKGFRNPRSQTSASFTADGQHIISASEDANVYVWNHVCDNSPLSTHVKSTWSSERFSSSNVSVAIPWHGIQSGKAIVGTSQDFNSQQNKFNGHAGVAYRSNVHSEDLYGSSTTYLSPSGSFTLRHDFFLESLPKGSATWPEEKLLSTSATSTLLKSHYKFLKNSCQNASHAWGQVIVTAGWDGRIRSYQNYGLPVHL